MDSGQDKITEKLILWQFSGLFMGNIKTILQKMVFFVQTGYIALHHQ